MTTTTAEPECDGIGAAPPVGEAQITFVRDGRLHAVDETADDDAPCLLDDAAGPVVWGPDATKVLVDGRIVSGDGVGAAELVATSSFTRPTGTSTIAVEGGRLIKTNLASGAETDISFLARHDDVTYYPSGTHVIAAGQDDAGTDGIWLATNTGADSLLLAESPDTNFSHLTVSEDGTTLVFAADHDGENHVHRAQLIGEMLATGEAEQDAETLVTTPDPIVSIALGIGGDVAVGHGTCDSGSTTLWTTLESEPASGWPVGFQPDGSLVYSTSSDGCFEPGDAFDLMLRPTGPEPAATAIATDVTAAALRMSVGEPPPPPADNLSGFT